MVRPVDVPESYLPATSSFWKPSFAPCEMFIPYTGPYALVYRALRLSYVLITIPIWLVVVTLSLHPPTATLVPTWLRPVPYLKAWSRKQRYLTPLLGRLVWSITYGVPPRFYEYIVPLYRWPFHHPRATVKRVVIPPADDLWICGVAKDPKGVVQPKKVMAYWIVPKVASERMGGLYADVVLVLNGGGFVEGHPLEGRRCFELAVRCNIKILGVNYRKAVNIKRVFPAALQDAVSAYAFLVNSGYKRIALMGDSAGGGLVMSLCQHLSNISRNAIQPSYLPPPSLLLLISPWLDLTVSFPSIRRNEPFDMISPNVAATSAWAYTRSSKIPRSDPLFSPSLPAAVHALANVVKFAPACRILIIYGTAELFVDECRAFCANLVCAGWASDGLEVVEVEGETHVFALLPDSVSSNAAKAHQRMEQFVQGWP